jgi:hypothetical protein
MWTSKFSTTLLSSTLLTATLFLSACNLPDTQKRKDGGDAQGSFFADEVSGTLLNEKFQEDISLPKERTYAMKVCIRDLKHSKPVINHPFKIEEIEKETSTDATGCLTWNESVEFEYLTDPVFIKIDRKIKSAGIHSGSYEVSFAINPWDTENYHNAIDLSKNKVSPLVEKDEVKAKLTGKSQKQEFELWVEDGRMFANDDKMGDSTTNQYQLKYEFNLAPYIKTKKTSGEDSQYTLKHGLFAGRIEIIHRYYVGGENEKNVYDIIASENFKDAKMEKGALSFSRVMTFNGGPPSRGSLFVRLYLEPMKPVQNLKPYVGIFPMGDFRSIRTNQFLKVLPSSDFKKEVEAQLPLAKNYLSGSVSASQATSTKGDTALKPASPTTARAQGTVSWTTLDFDSPVKGVQLLNHKRRITYPVHICFTNNLNQMPVAFQKFQVWGFSQNENVPGEDKKTLVSNVGGCIFWTDTVEYDIYECQRYSRGYVIIESKDFNLKIKRYYYLNPWDEYFGAKDSDKINNAEELRTSCDTDKPKVSEVVLQDVSIKTHSMKYENAINSLLEFSAPKEFGITIHPKVKIPSALKVDYDSNLDTLIDGAYLLRVMIVRNEDLNKKTDVIAQKDIPVLLRNGMAYARFVYSLKDQRLFHTRNTMYLQLLPIKHEKVTASDNHTLTLKNPSEPLEDIINPQTSLIYPVFKEDIVLTGEDFKTLRPFTGSAYTQHLQIDFNDKDSLFDFTALVNGFKAKTKQTEEASKKLAQTSVFAANHNLTLMNNSDIGNLPFAGWAQNVLNTHKISMDTATASKLCEYWFKNFWSGKFNLGEMLLRRACATASKEGIRTFFDFDHVYFIKNIGASEYAGPGPERGLSLGTSFSVNTSYSESFTNSVGVAGKLGAGAELGKFASVGAEVYTSFDFSRSSSKSDSNSIALGESSNLAVTESRFKIKATQYQFCITVKPNARLFQKSSQVWYLRWLQGEIDYTQFFKAGVTDQEKADLSQRGLMICNSADEKKEFSFIEQYYWVTAPLSANEIQDSHDERNKQFSIMIRGNQDYNRFKYLLSRKWTYPKNASSSAMPENYLDGLIQMQSWKTSPPGVYIYRDQ